LLLFLLVACELRNEGLLPTRTFVLRPTLATIFCWGFKEEAAELAYVVSFCRLSPHKFAQNQGREFFAPL